MATAPPPPPAAPEKPAPEPLPEPGPRRGGTLRLLAVTEDQAALLLRSALGDPVVPARLAASITVSEEISAVYGNDCRSIEFDANAVLPGAEPVRAADAVSFWLRAVDREGSDAAWLLDAARPPVEKIRAEDDGTATICLDTPDLELRLSHPALWYWRSDRGEGLRDGPGPFREDGPHRLVPNESFPGPGPYLEQIELVRAGEARPELLVRIGEADLAIVYGETAALLEQSDGRPLKLLRAPGWDLTYSLWLDPQSRWTNDPPFRRWLAAATDRESMVQLLFEGRGRPVYSLTSPAAGPFWTTEERAPFDARPRLELEYGAGDPFAERIASRLRAELDRKGVALAVRPARRSSQGAGLRLFVHRAPVEDPVLSLLGTLRAFAAGEEAPLDGLARAARLSGPGARTDAAKVVEQAWLIDARLIPLVTVHAYIVVDAELEAVESGPYGVLDLSGAWWNR